VLIGSYWLCLCYSLIIFLFEMWDHPNSVEKCNEKFSCWRMRLLITETETLRSVREQTVAEWIFVEVDGIIPALIVLSERLSKENPWRLEERKRLELKDGGFYVLIDFHRRKKTNWESFFCEGFIIFVPFWTFWKITELIS
jgi:hypothetical protein